MNVDTVVNSVVDTVLVFLYYLIFDPVGRDLPSLRGAVAEAVVCARISESITIQYYYYLLLTLVRECSGGVRVAARSKSESESRVKIQRVTHSREASSEI